MGSEMCIRDRIVAQYTCVRSGHFQRGPRAQGLIACAEKMYSSYSFEKILQVQVRRLLRARKCMCKIQASYMHNACKHAKTDLLSHPALLHHCFCMRASQTACTLNTYIRPHAPKTTAPRPKSVVARALSICCGHEGADGGGGATCMRGPRMFRQLSYGQLKGL